MSFAIPITPETWLTRAKNEGVDCLSPCDLPINGSNLPSASKLEVEVYLTFRSYWEERYAKDLRPGVLGISDEDYVAVKDYIKGNKYYGKYLDDINEFSSRKRPLGELPKLGAFTLVRHFQQQITQTDVFISSSKHAISPMMTRSRTAAAAAANLSTEDRTSRRLDFVSDGGTGVQSPSRASSPIRRTYTSR